MIYRRVLSVAVGALLIIGCYDPKPLTCPKRDVFCDGQPGGICVTANDGIAYCAFPAKDCPSMYRWAEFVAPALEKNCVDPALIEQHNRRDGGIDGGTMDGSATN